MILYFLTFLWLKKGNHRLVLPCYNDIGSRKFKYETSKSVPFNYEPLLAQIYVKDEFNKNILNLQNKLAVPVMITHHD